MKFVIFGLTVSSSWGNGHATLWRGLWRALVRRGHSIVFFEKDVPYYAAHRDLTELPGGVLRLYRSWGEVLGEARRALAGADVAMVTSYCPDPEAADLVMACGAPAKVFYDLDTPVTLDRLEAGEAVGYLPSGGLGGFDLVLSFTGGPALEMLRVRLGARRIVPLFGHVDPQAHRPMAPAAPYRGHLSYLGTYAADRQEALERLFVEPARRRPEWRFVIGGSLYPEAFPWARNIMYVHHLPPGEHPAFFCSSRLTLNVTRRAMARMGYCPSGRIFEAAACGVPVLSDPWEGLERFYRPGEEILVASTTEGALAALDLSDEELARIGRAARERTMADHTADRRAWELERALGG